MRMIITFTYLDKIFVLEEFGHLKFFSYYSQKPYQSTKIRHCTLPTIKYVVMCFHFYYSSFIQFNYHLHIINNTRISFSDSVGVLIKFLFKISI